MVRIIGITGGKGGTGKSTVATAVAYELAKEKKVLLVDADVDCPNDHLLLDIERVFQRVVELRIPEWDFDKCTRCGLCSKACMTNSIVSVKDQYPIFIKQQCNGCGACVLKCPTDAISWGKKEIGAIYSGRLGSLELLSGELKSNEPISEFIVNRLNDYIKEKSSEYDYVIVDTAAGTHCPVIAALEMCDQVFAVTEPTPLGKHDLELILDLAGRLGIKTSIVLNRADIGRKEIISSLADYRGLSIVSEIPYSKEIVNSYANGIPITDENIGKIIKCLEK